MLVYWLLVIRTISDEGSSRPPYLILSQKNINGTMGLINSSNTKYRRFILYVIHTGPYWSILDTHV